jgi:hypothetical protein
MLNFSPKVMLVGVTNCFDDKDLLSVDFDKAFIPVV